MAAQSAASLARAQEDNAWYGRAETTFGLHRSDYSTLSDATQTFLAEHGSVGWGAQRRVGARVDVLGGTFADGAAVIGVAGHGYLNADAGLIGVSVGHVRLQGGIWSNSFALNASLYEDALLTTAIGVGYEQKNFGEDLGFAELFLRIYPSERFLLTPGVSYAHADVKQTRADIIVRADYAVLQLLGSTLGAYVQYGGNTFTKISAGLTWYFDRCDYRTRDRQTGPVMARFK